MSLPRVIAPGRYYLITRRCTQRQFLLRPGRRTNHAFRYCLAEAAQRYGIEVVSFCAESNHHHTVVYDPHGNLSAFLAHFHKMLAKMMNARWGRWENFFATEQTCVTELLDPEAVFDKTAELELLTVSYFSSYTEAGHGQRVLGLPGRRR